MSFLMSRTRENPFQLDDFRITGVDLGYSHDGYIWPIIVLARDEILD